MTEQPVRYQQWSPREIETAARMWQTLVTDLHGEDDVPEPAKIEAYRRIGEKLKRNFTSVRQRYVLHGPSFNAGCIASRKISALTAATRDARLEATYRRDLTATFFGDPPPGYSALDRRKAQGVVR